MRFDQIVEYLNRSGLYPGRGAASDEGWKELKDVLELLTKSTTDDALVYANGQFGDTSAFVYSILVPSEKLVDDYQSKIRPWNFTCDQRWVSSMNPKRPEEAKAAPPLARTGSEILDRGLPITFHRFFAGSKNGSYVELNQMFSQLLNIHRVSERNAYSRFDEDGDYEDVAKIKDASEQFICSLKKADLDLVLLLTDSVVVRVFDFTRAPEIGFHALSGTSVEHDFHSSESEVFGIFGVRSSRSGEYLASWCRGFQVVRTTESPSNLIMRICGPDPAKRQYADYIIFDWKSKKVMIASCNPKQLDSYFADTGRPFQTSPAFFKGEVLLKYKAYPDKYRLGLDSVECRGAWSLRRFDLNEANQVVVLLCDLADLPHNEQLYWKSMNENPKGSVPKRMIVQEFMGEFSEDYDPLHSLIMILDAFPNARVENNDTSIWDYHGELKNRKASRLSYVFTDSSKEWEDQIKELANILNDGLRMGNLKKIAAKMALNIVDLGSIRVLERCLEAKKVDLDTIRRIIDPLADLQRLRSEVSVHADRGVPTGSLQRNFVQMLAKCDSSMRLLAELIEGGTLNMT